MVKMIPSPDWFVGVDSLNLCEGNQWKQEVTVDLHPYDAGTDSGFTFSSPNFPTSPPENITKVGMLPVLTSTSCAHNLTLHYILGTFLYCLVFIFITLQHAYGVSFLHLSYCLAGLTSDMKLFFQLRRLSCVTDHLSFPSMCLKVGYCPFKVVLRICWLS